jgi:hypothetical protein
MDGFDIMIETPEGDKIGLDAYSNNGSVAIKSSEMFQESLTLIENVTNSFVKKISGLENPPQEFEVEFGIVFKVDLGAIIAKTSAEGNFKVSLKWKTK